VVSCPRIAAGGASYGGGQEQRVDRIGLLWRVIGMALIDLLVVGFLWRLGGRGLPA